MTKVNIVKRNRFILLERKTLTNKQSRHDVGNMLYFWKTIYNYLIHWSSKDSPTCENIQQKKNNQINGRKLKTIMTGYQKEIGLNDLIRSADGHI